MLSELLSEPQFKAITPIVVNYDTDADFKSEWKASSRSTILVFRGGKEVGRVVGVTDKDALRRLLTAAAPAS